jgi:hypothetical protein
MTGPEDEEVSAEAEPLVTLIDDWAGGEPELAADVGAIPSEIRPEPAEYIYEPQIAADRDGVHVFPDYVVWDESL